MATVNKILLPQLKLPANTWSMAMYFTNAVSWHVFWIKEYKNRQYFRKLSQVLFNIPLIFRGTPYIKCTLNHSH